MKKSTIIYIIIGLVTSLVVVPLVVVDLLSTSTASHSRKLTNNPPVRTDNEVATAIAKSNQYLHDSSGKPAFKLLKVKRLANNWYMAWIDDETTKVLVNDPSESADYMNTVLGPSATFNSQDIYTKGIPSAVFKEFNDATYN